MKRLCVLFAMFVSSVSLAETWYSYCSASKNDTRICTTPEIKHDDFKLKCMSFAEDMGAHTYMIKSSTDLAALEASISDNCDEVRGSEHGHLFACQYAVLCPKNQPQIRHFASRVYAMDAQRAIDRCASQNATKIRQELKRQSMAGCYLKLVAEKMTDASL